MCARRRNQSVLNTCLIPQKIALQLTMAKYQLPVCRVLGPQQKDDCIDKAKYVTRPDSSQNLRAMQGFNLGKVVRALSKQITMVISQQIFGGRAI